MLKCWIWTKSMHRKKFDASKNMCAVKGIVDPTALALHCSKYWFTTSIKAGSFLIHLKSRKAICHTYLTVIFPNKHQVLKTVHEASLLRPLGSVLFWLAVKWPFVNSHLSDIHSAVPERALSLLPRGRSYSNFHVLWTSRDHRSSAGFAFFGSGSVCIDKGRKWSRFIAHHLSSQTRRKGVQLQLPNIIQAPVIYWLQYRGC